jgi:hypothetical protein
MPATAGQVLVTTENGHDGSVGSEGEAENHPTGEAPGATNGLRHGGNHAAEEAGDRERADSCRAASRLCGTSPPAAFEPDQEPDTKRNRQA